jgi:hypothetical protein
LEGAPSGTILSIGVAGILVGAEANRVVVGAGIAVELVLAGEAG